MQKSTGQTILLVENSLPLTRIYEEFLRQEGYMVVAEQSGKGAKAFLERFIPAAIVLDLLLPDTNGIEILQFAKELYPKLPVVVVTATNSVNVAVDAMRKGAFDFIVKPFPAARLTITLRNAIERSTLMEEVSELRQVLGQSQFYDFIGQSPAMQAVYRVIESVAPSKASVFIKGESGTGKELAAQAIHKASLRRARPFVAINCAAIPRDLLESHIFGHIKGAFTGAFSDQQGAAQQANGGTLFLDEICELPLELQAKLLRFLQTGEVTPIGSRKTETVDVRVVAATNRDPLKEVRAGRFREDLYYRLHVVPLDMPPLRDREEDILRIAQHFLSKFSLEEGKNFSCFDTDVMAIMHSYDWPGNVRQLENAVRSMVVLNKGEKITRDMLPEDIRRFAEKNPLPAANENAQYKELSSFANGTRPHILPLWLAEKRAIMEALSFTQQDVTRAAALLEVSPSTLYRKLQAWKMEHEVA